MRRLGLSAAVVALFALAAGAEEKTSFQNPELAPVGGERVKAFRDLKVKDAKKQDIVVVRLEVRWTAEKRHVLVKDGDVALKDGRGKTHDCALHFVQASAPADGAPSVIEIPFRVPAEAAIVSLRLGKIWVPFENPASAPR
jgi:hypothetical protein